MDVCERAVLCLSGTSFVACSRQAWSSWLTKESKGNCAAAGSKVSAAVPSHILASPLNHQNQQNVKPSDVNPSSADYDLFDGESCTNSIRHDAACKHSLIQGLHAAHTTMKTTAVLSARMRQFLANLHPPSPPTQQEGRELIGLLQTSFKRQLDFNHPAPRAPDVVDGQNIPLKDEVIIAQANQHLQWILNHPLVDSPNSRSRNILSAWDAAYAENRLALPLMRSLLSAYLFDLKAQRHSKSIDSQNCDSLSSRLNAWLYGASHTDRDNFFLFTHVILKPAIEVLTFENQESLIWNWLRIVYERLLIRAELSDTRWLAVEDTIVSLLMRNAIHRGDNAEAAAHFVQAAQYRMTSGRTAPVPTQHDSDTYHYALTESWKRLGALIIYNRSSHDIPADIFDSAMKYAMPFQEAPSSALEFCMIYHPDPELASHQPLVAALRNKANRAVFLTTQKTASKPARQALLTCLEDAAQSCQEKGNRKEAASLLNFAHETYKDLLPPGKKMVKEDGVVVPNGQLLGGIALKWNGQNGHEGEGGLMPG